MASYRLTRQARAGFLGILESVERDFGVLVAERVLDRIEAAFGLLAENPDIGHAREDLTADGLVQFWAVGPTLIAYRQGDDGLEVLMVERGERDWGSLLDPEL